MDSGSLDNYKGDSLAMRSEESSLDAGSLIYTSWQGLAAEKYPDAPLLTMFDFRFIWSTCEAFGCRIAVVTKSIASSS